MTLFISFALPFNGKKTSMIVGDDKAFLVSDIESKDNKGRIEIVNGADFIRRLQRISDGKKEPFYRFLAGNEYYGFIRLAFKRTDKPGTEGTIKVKVFSALGKTVEEHFKRYEQNKSKRYQQQTSTTI